MYFIFIEHYVIFKIKRFAKLNKLIFNEFGKNCIETNLKFLLKTIIFSLFLV